MSPVVERSDTTGTHRPTKPPAPRRGASHVGWPGFRDSFPLRVLRASVRCPLAAHRGGLGKVSHGEGSKTVSVLSDVARAARKNRALVRTVALAGFNPRMTRRAGSVERGRHGRWVRARPRAHPKTHPGGMPACSRWLSAATPPDMAPPTKPCIPEGCQTHPTFKPSPTFQRNRSGPKAPDAVEPPADGVVGGRSRVPSGGQKATPARFGGLETKERGLRTRKPNVAGTF